MSPSIFAMLMFVLAARQGDELGVFESHGDVGVVHDRGSASFDPVSKRYTVAGGGENMWFKTDACHFVWKRVEGDVEIAAKVQFVGKGGNPHRKACLMIRQSLDADSAYVDAAVHGDGLTSLQFRDVKGADTHEVQSHRASPTHVRLIKRGAYTTLHVAVGGGPLEFSGAAARVDFRGPVFIGLCVCSHEKNAMETAVFSNVEVSKASNSTNKSKLYSTLETQSLASSDRRVVYVAEGRNEAPNWLKDGKTLVFNSRGRLYRIPATGGTPVVVDTGFAVRCNNDHGVSPDGALFAVSDQSLADRKSRIYTVPIGGGAPTLVTPNAPSYWHGWSPNGENLAFCAERNGEFDVYRISVRGGKEHRLTDAKGLDDGPEYSHDGKHIYFNSDRTGRMHLWKMEADGGDQTQVTDDDYNNWFPHPSPDGRTLVFLSYSKDVKGHPEDKDVQLRRLNLASRKIDVLARFLGGQGTINVPCFSPDSKRIAFVTYQWLP